jgi:toxin ParE1/3/4
MTTRFVLTKVAHRELDDQAFYLADKAGPATAIDFCSAAEAAFELLAKMPKLGPIRDFGRQELQGLRMWPIWGFDKHLIFYRPTEQDVEIVRVLHASRDIEGILKHRQA